LISTDYDEKMCSKCKSILTVDKFYRETRRNGGYAARCKDCQSTDNKLRYKTQKTESLAKGICVRFGCSSKLTSDSYSYCIEHFFSNANFLIARSTLGWELIRDIAERQDYKCAITGTDLIPGVNMSLDHIKPKSRFPELRSDLSNLQWVDKWVNIAKSDLDLDDFIARCTQVANRYN